MRKKYLDAVSAFAEFCKNGTPVMCADGKEHMLVYNQPSEAESVVGRKYVYLRNCNGDLCRYVIRTGEIIL